VAICIAGELRTEPTAPLSAQASEAKADKAKADAKALKRLFIIIFIIS
jgi:hypothetical protein